MSDLSALLDREASAEIESLLSEARTRASEIIAEANAEAEQILAQKRRAAQSQREATLVRAQSSAQLEASALKLRAQHAAVESVFEVAQSRLAEIAADPAVYRRVLEVLLSEAVAAVGPSDVVAVHAAPADVPLVEKLVARSAPTATVAADPTVRLGVRVVTSRHSTIENTLPQRLAALEGELAAQVSSVLFGQAPEA